MLHALTFLALYLASPAFAESTVVLPSDPHVYTGRHVPMTAVGNAQSAAFGKEFGFGNGANMGLQNTSGGTTMPTAGGAGAGTGYGSGGGTGGETGLPDNAADQAAADKAAADKKEAEAKAAAADAERLRAQAENARVQAEIQRSRDLRAELDGAQRQADQREARAFFQGTAGLPNRAAVLAAKLQDSQTSPGVREALLSNIASEPTPSGGTALLTSVYGALPADSTDPAVTALRTTIARRPGFVPPPATTNPTS